VPKTRRPEKYRKNSMADQVSTRNTAVGASWSWRPSAGELGAGTTSLSIIGKLKSTRKERREERGAGQAPAVVQRGG
jgi:hypothetical protein